MKFFGMTFNSTFNSQDIFTDDLRKSAYTENPTIIADIDLVYVLSGRTTALGNDADGLNREFDPSDDLARLCEGIRIATTINTLRANKNIDDLTVEDYVTPIFYNGRTIHNHDLEEALERNLLPYYPKERFIIHSITPENTIGQIQSFTKYISNHHHENVAVVSSAYHLPRVARTIGKDSPQISNENNLDEISPLSKLKLFLYGVHKNEKRPGITLDLQGEHGAMQRYSSGETPFISKHQSKNVYLTDEDFGIYKSFAASLFWGNRKMVNEQETETKECSIVPYAGK